jgi:hypothetical protein
MAAPPSRVQFANIVSYHLLITLVNLLNLPLEDGTFIPRRGWQLRVMSADIERLRMLKQEFDVSNEDAVRGYLVAAKATLFELEVALHQWPELQRNAEFAADLARLQNILGPAHDLVAAEGARDLAYKLSVMLPFYEDEDAMRERNATAAAWFDGRA